MKTLKLIIGLGLIANSLSSCATPNLRKGETMNNTTSPQIYRFESDSNGFNTNTIFYDNGTEVVAFDAQFTPDQAKKAIAFLRTKSSNPIKYLVISHPNPDKFNGASVFKEEGAIVIASRATSENIPGVHAYKKYFFVNIAAMFTEENYPQLTKVDRVFEKSMELRLSNGESIHLEELGKAGVSTNQTIALIPNQKALIVGDLIHNNVHAWLEGGIANNQPQVELASWKNILKQLSNFSSEATLVYGGRGEAGELNLSLKRQMTYLEKAEAIVEQYLEQLGERKAELKGNNAGLHYEALAKVFAKEFGSYQHSYMIQYGIYGLLNSKL
jgi:glyoxylase-like metal-dependent hydrolase (beta-lactamase superfamily II)